jgi:hypothetical protein
MLAESLDDLTGLVLVQEQLHIEAFVAEFSVEALPVGIFPGAARLDVEGLNVLPSQPLLQGSGNELGTIVATQELGSALLSDEDFQDLSDLACIEGAGHFNGQALAGELIDHRQQSQLLAVDTAVLEKVVGPNVVGKLGLLRDFAQAPPTSSLGSLAQRQTPQLPESVDPLGIDRIALPSQ